jgi:hypothetical protein
MRPPTSPVTVSKADFVRARAHLSPKEIVEDAKAQGIKFEAGYVYNVRGADQAAAKRKPAKATAPATKPSATVKPTTKSAILTKAVPVPRPITNGSSAEDFLRAVAAEIGLGRGRRSMWSDSGISRSADFTS